MIRNIPIILWIVPGLVLQSCGLFLGRVSLSVLGTVLLVAGLSYYVKRKGYHPAWGFWGLVPVMGPIILILQRPYYAISRDEMLDEMLLEEDPHIRSFGLRRRLQIIGGLPLFLLAAPIGIAVLLFSPWLVGLVVPHETANLPATAAVAAPEEPVEPAPVPVPAPETPPAPEPPASPPVEEANLSVTQVTLPATKTESESTIPVKEQNVAGEADQFRAQYENVRVGMTFDEIEALMGDDALFISGRKDSDAVVNWRGPDGLFFVAKLAAGKLERKTPLRTRPRASEIKDTVGDLAQLMVPEAFASKNDAEKEEPDSAQEAGGKEESQQEPAVQEDEGEEDVSEEEPAPEEQPAATQTSRVVRLGANAKEGEVSKPAGRTTYKKPKLPKFSHPLDRGPSDVYIHNPNEESVRVGIRSGRAGKDISIAGEGEAVVYLTNGTYSLFYIDPENNTVQNAGSFVVDAPPQPIHISLR